MNDLEFTEGDKITLNTGYPCDTGIFIEYEDNKVVWKDSDGKRYKSPISDYNITLLNNPMQKKLIEYGGGGYGGCKENEVYEVKTTKTKTFSKLSEARKYYNSVNDEKCLWDKSRGAELLEGHMYQYEADDESEPAFLKDK